MSSGQAQHILELILFFISFYFFLNLFKAIDFSKLFKKGHTKEIQLTYILTVLIFSYLFTQALIRIIEITTGLF